jgi:hypothetical protein
MGSLAWWLILSCTTAHLGKKASDKLIYSLNRISGLLILLCGCVAALATLKNLLD